MSEAPVVTEVGDDEQSSDATADEHKQCPAPEEITVNAWWSAGPQGTRFLVSGPGVAFLFDRVIPTETRGSLVGVFYCGMFIPVHPPYIGFIQRQTIMMYVSSSSVTSTALSPAVLDLWFEDETKPSDVDLLAVCFMGIDKLRVASDDPFVVRQGPAGAAMVAAPRGYQVSYPVRDT